MAVEIIQNEDISKGGKNGGEEGVGFAIRRRRANMGRINLKKREPEELFSGMLSTT